MKHKENEWDIRGIIKGMTYKGERKKTNIYI